MTSPNDAYDARIDVTSSLNDGYDARIDVDTS